MTALIERYRDVLPVTSETPVVTLGEGATPLIRAERLSRQFGIDLWLKLEGLNPTGSFKDRGMAVAVSKALEEGARGLVCASTGNTAASAAAYAARAGLPAVIVHPEGAVAPAKLAQTQVVGARVLEVSGTFGDAFATALELAEREGYTFVNSTNPYRLEGQKTAALEILDGLGGVPDAIALPYGGGGNTTAYAKGLDETDARPRLLAVEARRRGDTFASAIRIVEPVHRAEVEAAIERFGGAVVSADEDELARAQAWLAQIEGVHCEPASAASLAGALTHAALGERVVCVLTGHGLKDTPDRVE